MKLFFSLFSLLITSFGFSQVFLNPSLTGTQGVGVVAPSWTTILPSPDLTTIPSGIGFTFFAGGATVSPDGGTFQLFGQSDGTTEALGQTVSGFTIGETYVVTYYEGNFGPCPGGGTCYTETGEIEVTISGVGTYTSGNILSVSDEWLVGCVPFVATSTTHTISFTAHRIVPSGITWLAIDFPQITLGGLGGGVIDDFYYADSVLCLGDAPVLPTIVGDLGGSYSSAPVGLSLDAGTGEVDPSGSDPGIYTVTYALGGCAGGTATATVEIYDNVVANFEFENVCLGEAMDFTNTSIYSGAEPSWEWDFGGEGTSTDASPSFTFTTAGTYEVELVGDTGGPCNDTITIEVTVFDNPTVTAMATPTEVCLGESVILTGGGADSYVWDMGVTDGVPYTPASLGLITFTVTGTTAGTTCSSTATVDVDVYDAPTVVASVDDNEICLGESVIFTGSGAATYTWDMGVVDGVPYTPGALGTVTYTVTGTTGGGVCFGTATVDVEVVDAPPVFANVDDADICLGESVTFTGSGADTYTWDMGVVDGVPYTPATAGIITYTVTGDVGGGICANTATVDVEVYALPVVVASVDDANICIGESVIFTGSGADSYVWDMGVTNGVPFTPPAVGTATYTVTGTNVTTGCVNTATINVNVTNVPVVVANVDAIEICLGESVVFTGSGAETYTWDMGVTNGVPFTPTTVGTQTYTVVGNSVAANCSGTDAINVTVNPLPIIVFSADTTTVCNPYTINFTSSTPGDSFYWNFGDGASGTGSTVSHTYNVSGVFDVTLTATSLLGCTNSLTVADYIETHDYPVANFTYSPTVIDIMDTEVDFTNYSTGADLYEWDFGDGSAISNVINPNHIFPATGNMLYSVELTAINSLGCESTYVQIIQVNDIILFYIPNSFTPDGDSFNETFVPIFAAGLDIYDYHLMIFNRWGETVFESYNVAYGWDGTYGSSGVVQDGTFVWQIEFGETMSDKTHVEHGHVTILK